MLAEQAPPGRTTAVAAASRTLAEFLEADGRAAELLEDPGPLPGAPELLDTMRSAAAAGGGAGIRIEKRRRLLAVAGRDLTGEIELREAGRALSDLADACLQAVLELHGTEKILSVVAMGKLGSRELNYVSDIDIMFVGNAADPAVTKAASALLSELGEFSPQGRAYEIDTNLRPEGRNGPLVRSLESYLEYYRRWAHTWEYQALIKARAAAGDRQIGEQLVEATRPIVFPDEVTGERVASIRKMKARVERHAPPALRGAKPPDAADVKLGPGGIRDVEFSVQLLQLVHGGADETVRVAATLDAIDALSAGGYIAEEDGAGLADAYRWLRNVEHRLQLWQERRVRHLPEDEPSRARLARTMGFKDSPTESAAAGFERAHSAVLADVRNRFEKLFYRPMIESLSDAPHAGLSQAALKERLRVLGFRDVDRAARTLTGMLHGSSRRAKLFRVLTPPLLRWLASTPLPDEGLFQFLLLGESLEKRLDALGALRDNPPGLELFARVLGSGRWFGRTLAQVPEEIATIADPRGPGAPKQRERLAREAQAALAWREPERRPDGLRRFKRREMLRIAVADIAGAADVISTGAGLADLADACLEAAIEERSMPFAVIGMGKLGGRELHYPSDIDVMFVHEGDPAEAELLATRLLKVIGETTSEGQAFQIDPALRPEGKAGSLARSLDSFIEYSARWAKPWEHHALVKARVSAGDHELGERLLEKLRDFAYPESIPTAALGEMRHLKARMERERIPRGVDPRRHIKMGPGGLADIEFAVQMIQRAHGHNIPSLRVTGTLDALEAARREDLIFGGDAEILRDGYEFLTLLRNRQFFIAGRANDQLPPRPEDLEALGIAAGFQDQPRQELEERYLRVTRRVRKIAEPLIFGASFQPRGPSRPGNPFPR